MSLCDDLRRRANQKHLEQKCQQEQQLVEALAAINWLERNILNADPLPKFGLPAVIQPAE